LTFLNDISDFLNNTFVKIVFKSDVLELRFLLHMPLLGFKFLLLFFVYIFIIYCNSWFFTEN
jgi:hypothetical protein